MSNIRNKRSKFRRKQKMQSNSLSFGIRIRKDITKEELNIKLDELRQKILEFIMS